MLRTRENSDVFNTLNEIYLVIILYILGVEADRN